MKTTSLWTPSAEYGGKLVHGPIRGGDQLGSRAERLPVLQAILHAFSKFAETEAFWAKALEFSGVSLASAATGPVFTNGRAIGGWSLFGGLNCAENLLREKPQYSIACSN